MEIQCAECGFRFQMNPMIVEEGKIIICPECDEELYLEMETISTGRLWIAYSILNIDLETTHLQPSQLIGKRRGGCTMNVVKGSLYCPDCIIVANMLHLRG